MNIEVLTAVTLGGLPLNLFRLGKSNPLNSSLAINHRGQFHALLDSMFNLSQPFLENISRLIVEQTRKIGNSKPLYFEVIDKEIRSHREKIYLLAITLLDGAIFFQAVAPQKNENHLDRIHAYFNDILLQHPETLPRNEVTEGELIDAIQTLAKQRRTVAVSLTENVSVPTSLVLFPNPCI